jgi:hypothetical protein
MEMSGLNSYQSSIMHPKARLLGKARCDDEVGGGIQGNAQISFRDMEDMKGQEMSSILGGMMLDNSSRLDTQLN